MCKFIFGIATILALSACSTPGNVAQYRSNPYRDCMNTIAINPDFSLIAEKTATRDVTDITTAMLSDDSYPTAEEKPLISKWSDARARCFATYTSTLKEDMPPEAFEVVKASVDKQKILASDLYAGRLTYGQFNRTRISDKQSVDSAFQRIRELSMARQDQDAERKRQILLMQLQSQLNRPPASTALPAPYMMPLPATTPTQTNCTTVGNQVNCVSR